MRKGERERGFSGGEVGDGFDEEAVVEKSMYSRPSC